MFAFVILTGMSLIGVVNGAEPQLIVEPAIIALTDRSPSAQFIATRIDPDGSYRDVTREVEWTSVNPKLVTITSVGFVNSLRPGSTRVVARHKELVAEAQVSVAPQASDHRISFRGDIVPLLTKLGCNQGACHGNLNGKGGFRLSLRGDSPEFDLLAITRQGQGRRVELLRPGHSLILRKPLGHVPHEGGVRIDLDSREHQLLVQWLRQGATDDGDKAPQQEQLKLLPADRVVAYPCTSQQLVVLCEDSQGAVYDVTQLATFDLDDPTKGTVDSSGLVTVVRPCETTVAIRYGTKRGVVRLAFLPNRPQVVNVETSSHPIDRAVIRKLTSLRMTPSRLTDDSSFLRRLYLSVLGRLPTIDETRSFLADRLVNKRAARVDEVLAQPELAEFWAMKWSDVLRNEEKTMSPEGVRYWHEWLRSQIVNDVPISQMARALVSSTGKTYENPPASLYRVCRDPTVVTETVAQVFLGYRLQCAKCHNHPFDVWTQNDYYGMAAFFAGVDRKQLETTRKDKFDKHEIKGDVVISLVRDAKIINPTTGETIFAKGLGSPASTIAKPEQSLERFADWLTTNPQFSRNMANRIWYHVMGRGIVDPPDDFRDSNLASNPELLEIVTAEFVKNNSRLKPLLAFILKSETFQRSVEPNETNAEGESNFARAIIRPLPAEILLDAIGDVTQVRRSFPKQPTVLRAVGFPGVQTMQPFLKTFGKPARLVACECERTDGTTLAQSLQTINGPVVQTKIGEPTNRIGTMLDHQLSGSAMIEELYLAAFSRLPTPPERDACLKHLNANDRDRRVALEDILWAILNSKEFLLHR